MLKKTTDTGPSQKTGPGFGEFVFLVALMMALGSFSIDNMLPAFGPIGQTFGIADENSLQLIITSYMIGFGVMQLVYGPVSDAIGRRPTLMIGLAIYLVGCVAAILAPNYHLLLAARILQGLGVAAVRVLSVAIVRDRFEGREMARVMSLTLMVFLIVPTIAPAIGGLILHVSHWRMIFGSMLVLALVVAVWFWMKMPETLHPAYRVKLQPREIARGFRLTATNRLSAGYATASGLMMGCIMTYVGSSQQIFETDVYGLGVWFPAMFAAIALTMACAAFFNSMLVERFGMRALSHGGALLFTGVTGLQLVAALAYGGHPPLWLFGVSLAAAHFLFSVVAPNFNAMAMEPMGAIAGTASSAIGFYTTLMGAGIGFLVGQAFDGTVTPLCAGYFAIGIGCILVVLWTERGRLFKARHGVPDKAAATDASFH